MMSNISPKHFDVYPIPVGLIFILFSFSLVMHFEFIDLICYSNADLSISD